MHRRLSRTFAEEYHEKVKALAKVQSSSYSTANLIPKDTLTEETLERELNKFAILLENDSGNTLSKIKSMMQLLPQHLKNSFMRWHDQRGLDVIQMCIVFNKPDVIRFILEDKSMFPQGYEPVSNPYAHLAATVGNLECLDALLTARPTLFFKGTQGHHAVKLPQSIKSLNRIPEGGMKINRNVQKLLKRVTDDAMYAERYSDNPRKKSRLTMDSSDVDMANIINSISKEKKPKGLKSPQRSLSALSSSSIQHNIGKSESGGKTRFSALMTPKIETCQPRRIKTGDHVLTVYNRDVFEDQPQGVIRGAGPAVRIAYPQDDKQDEISRNSLPSISDVRILNQRSRLRVFQSMSDGKGDSLISHKSKTEERGKSLSNLSDISRKNTSNSADRRPSLTLPKSRKMSSMFKKIEIGLRTIKKYKDFQLEINSRKLKFGDDKSYLNKTPLTMAAERGHLECIHYLLINFILKRNPQLSSNEPLTLATVARSPESLAVLLTNKYNIADFQNAVLTALREFYPACLTVLLSGIDKDRTQLFEGKNLLHLLYSQSLNVNNYEYKFEMMPEMTRTLINCREDVNIRKIGGSHPMYTLISCAFNVDFGRYHAHYLECLKIILSFKANPHYNEVKDFIYLKQTQSINRKPYSSALHCIFENAEHTITRLERPIWSRIIMQKFVACIVTYDKTPRRILDDTLFVYVERVCTLGLDPRILRLLLRYGANPDFKVDNQYVINKFFQIMLPFLTKFQVMTDPDDLLNALMMICHNMSPDCLHDAFHLFLEEHLLRTPLQALPLTRKFCYEVNQEVRSPRSLLRLTSLFTWKHLQRNSLSVRKLPVSHEVMNLIMPSQAFC